MDDENSFSPTYAHSTSPSISQPRTPVPNSSGITLLLPSLKSLKSSKSSKKAGAHRSSSVFAGAFQDHEIVEKKPARPVKLKPLKEVLAKLIAQIKKKDDYAFFLHPVDPGQVPGYRDAIQHPMDFGTMTTKVEKGRYRSLEEFTSDLKLVTSNAKIFNPPGSIYSTEAEKIESWALDHIGKAALTVIQYEADWNVDIEKDDENLTVDIDNDEDGSIEVESVHDGRSASVVSQPVPGSSRRGPRIGYKKGAGVGVAESIEPDGHLPGAKDGLGAFPPGSDWARTMLKLKHKGKRYRTKKERLRIEKEGPPLLLDGSLDYTEMEDPFSFLSFLVPDPPSRPYLAALYPPLTTSFSQAQPSGQSTPVSQRSRSAFPTATSAPLTYSFSLPKATSAPASTLKRRYWTITRNLVSRTKGKEKEDDLESGDIVTWQTPREAHATDFGTFALLAGELAQEMRRRGGLDQVTGVDEEEQDVMLDVIRNSVDCETGVKAIGDGSIVEPTTGADVLGGALFYPKDYWSPKRAAEAEAYLRDNVYGGVDGLAYVRSLAEFVTSYESEDCFTNYRTGTVFGDPLATWVEREIVQPLTDGRHALLQQTAEQLLHISTWNVPPGHLSRIVDGESRTLEEQVYLSLHVYPTAMVALSALLQISTHKIDMGALLRAPEELFQSEEEWAGKKRHKQPDAAKEENARGGTELEEPRTAGTETSNTISQSRISDLESAEQLTEVLNYVADAIASQDKKLRKIHLTEGEAGGIKVEEQNIEDPILRNIRLNLLALAKRAPLDTIARLPKDLVPEHIRRFVPTLGET